MPEVVEVRFTADFINKKLQNSKIYSITFPTGLYRKKDLIIIMIFVKLWKMLIKKNIKKKILKANNQ